MCTALAVALVDGLYCTAAVLLGAAAAPVIASWGAAPALTAGLILWLYFTRRAVLEGRGWGRVSSIVIAVLSLLLIPFGTVLGLMMLVGAFDRGVQAYFRG